ncbi:MAG: hypothetical protein M3458_18500 [Acidobacteriota bacterium]|nr:hypothetical protein [Acidobacteriota bacterium]MDQ3652220.1 hypothetical protein [Acidobacteriota bacterium]
MHTSSTVRFRKLKGCPSAETILLLIETNIGLEKQQEVATHLATCDFCGAEMYLLVKHYVTVSGFSQWCEMPLPLRHLAEHILGSETFTPVKLVETVHQTDRLSLTDA